MKLMVPVSAESSPESFAGERNDCSQTADLQTLISIVWHELSITGYFAFGLTFRVPQEKTHPVMIVSAGSVQKPATLCRLLLFLW